MTETKEKVHENESPKNITTEIFQLNAQSPTVGKIAKALAKAQTELKGAKKNKASSYFKNHEYSDIFEVIDATQDTLGKNGIATTQGSWTCIKSAGFYVWTQLTHDSGEWMRNAVRLSLGKADNHCIGTAMTYGRRYTLAAMVGIGQLDDDAESTVEPPKKAPKTRAESSEGIKVTV